MLCTFDATEALYLDNSPGKKLANINAILCVTFQVGEWIFFLFSLIDKSPRKCQQALIQLSNIYTFLLAGRKIVVLP
jgi:hypothetical protein